jgi:Predicted EndoIII-related endonuclease
MLIENEKNLTGMTNTMNSVKPPRITALRDLHNAETGPFSILIGTILSARTKDETTTKAVKALFKNIRIQKILQMLKSKM